MAQKSGASDLRTSRLRMPNVICFKSLLSSILVCGGNVSVMSTRPILVESRSSMLGIYTCPSGRFLVASLSVPLG